MYHYHFIKLDHVLLERGQAGRYRLDAQDVLTRVMQLLLSERAATQLKQSLYKISNQCFKIYFSLGSLYII